MFKNVEGPWKLRWGQLLQSEHKSPADPSKTTAVKNLALLSQLNPNLCFIDISLQKKNSTLHPPFLGVKERQILEMASNPPSTCCTVGVKHTYVSNNSSNRGEPTGSSIKIGSIEAYIAEPKGKTVHKDTAILFLPDVIGIWQNSKLMADQYAENGYYTLIPDLFNGDALTLNRHADFDFQAWLTKGTGGNNPHTIEAVDPIVEKSIKYLQEKGFKKIGAVGYCFVRIFNCGS
jgi:hypothetical protein